MPEHPSMEETFGTMSLCFDSTPKHDSDKLDYGGIMASDATRETSASREVSPSEARAAGSGTDADDDDESGSREGPDDRTLPALSARAGASRPGGPVKPGTEEAFYLLATYCFDLQRKMEYLFKATRAFALAGDPAIARELLADERHINAPNLMWWQRALRAEARMLELQREIGKEHLRLLKQVASSDRPHGGGGGERPPGRGGPSPGGPT